MEKGYTFLFVFVFVLFFHLECMAMNMRLFGPVDELWLMKSDDGVDNLISRHMTQLCSTSH